MTTPATLAPEIDRLVWAVGNRVRGRHGSDSFPASSALPAPVFGTLFNLAPFLDDLSKPFVLRRYVYRPREMMDQFFDTLTSHGYMTSDGEQLRPAEPLAAVRSEMAAVTREVAGELWRRHPESVDAASEMARTVMEASEVRDGHAQAGIAAPEPDDVFHLLHQRLAILRLTRNEAHVAAWQALGLSPADVEVLTDAWAGTKLQAPLSISDRLHELGYVQDGSVTAEGLAVRQKIEDATNEGVATAFSSVDQSAFLAALQDLPGQP